MLGQYSVFFIFSYLLRALPQLVAFTLLLKVMLGSIGITATWSLCVAVFVLVPALPILISSTACSFYGKTWKRCGAVASKYPIKTVSITLVALLATFLRHLLDLSKFGWEIALIPVGAAFDPFSVQTGFLSFGGMTLALCPSSSYYDGTYSATSYDLYNRSYVEGYYPSVCDFRLGTLRQPTASSSPSPELVGFSGFMVAMILGFLVYHSNTAILSVLAKASSILAPTQTECSSQGDFEMPLESSIILSIRGIPSIPSDSSPGSPTTDTSEGSNTLLDFASNDSSTAAASSNVTKPLALSPTPSQSFVFAPATPATPARSFVTELIPLREFAMQLRQDLEAAQGSLSTGSRPISTSPPSDSKPPIPSIRLRSASDPDKSISLGLSGWADGIQDLSPAAIPQVSGALEMATPPCHDLDQLTSASSIRSLGSLGSLVPPKSDMSLASVLNTPPAVSGHIYVDLDTGNELAISSAAVSSPSVPCIRVRSDSDPSKSLSMNSVNQTSGIQSSTPHSRSRLLSPPISPSVFSFPPPATPGFFLSPPPSALFKEEPSTSNITAPDITGLSKPAPAPLLQSKFTIPPKTGAVYTSTSTFLKPTPGFGQSRQSKLLASRGKMLELGLLRDYAPGERSPVFVENPYSPPPPPHVLCSDYGSEGERSPTVPLFMQHSSSRPPTLKETPEPTSTTRISLSQLRSKSLTGTQHVTASEPSHSEIPTQSSSPHNTEGAPANSADAKESEVLEELANDVDDDQVFANIVAKANEFESLFDVEFPKYVDDDYL